MKRAKQILGVGLIIINMALLRAGLLTPSLHQGEREEEVSMNFNLMRLISRDAALIFY